MMTNRQRLFAALEGKALDRTPMWLLFPYHTTRYYVDVQTNPCYTRVFEESKKYAIMLNRRNMGARIWGAEVGDVSETVEEKGWKISRRTLTYKGERLVAEHRTRGGGD